jgi:maltoporin
LVALLLVGAAASTGAPEGFDFGSYGRIAAATDLDGGSALATNVVSHGSRLEEPAYLELDLYYAHALSELAARWRVVTSIAYGGTLPHYAGFPGTLPRPAGSFDGDVLLRNLFLQVEGVLHPALTLWVGSRMYRGDDIYLFDYWPLDNLNTVGAGAFFRPPGWELALHVGTHRLADAYQFQELPRPSPAGGPPDQVVTLDRQRYIESFKLTHFFQSRLGPGKLSLYAEAHQIGHGKLQDPDTMTSEALPADEGYLVGAQLGVWGRPNRFANLWLRFATGLAAYGELAVPFGLDAQKRAASARELVLASAGNWDGVHAGVFLGGYLRYFSPASPSAPLAERYWEGIVAARPHWFVRPYYGIAAELSWQTRQSDALDPLTGAPQGADVFKVSVMPAVITLAPGVLGRPQLRLVWTASFLSAGARAQLSQLDDRLKADTIQYLGVQAEWWFNSAYR